MDIGQYAKKTSQGSTYFMTSQVGFYPFRHESGLETIRTPVCPVRNQMSGGGLLRIEQNVPVKPVAFINLNENGNICIRSPDGLGEVRQENQVQDVALAIERIQQQSRAEAEAEVAKSGVPDLGYLTRKRGRPRKSVPTKRPFLEENAIPPPPPLIHVQPPYLKYPGTNPLSPVSTSPDSQVSSPSSPSSTNLSEPPSPVSVDPRKRYIAEKLQRKDSPTDAVDLTTKNSRPLECPVCTDPFSSENILELHLKSCHGVESHSRKNDLSAEMNDLEEISGCLSSAFRKCVDAFRTASTRIANPKESLEFSAELATECAERICSILRNSTGTNGTFVQLMRHIVTSAVMRLLETPKLGLDREVIYRKASRDKLLANFCQAFVQTVPDLLRMQEKRKFGKMAQEQHVSSTIDEPRGNSILRAL